GRAFVKAMETVTLEALDGQQGRELIIADNALTYAALLREHIAKEDDILYPLAERVIPDTMRDDIIAGYTAAEARTAADFTAHYEAVVVGYEQEL
ncbi:MAG TPA: cation-binding protein, partial [Desulfuromonadaceae bacterium]